MSFRGCSHNRTALKGRLLSFGLMNMITIPPRLFKAVVIQKKRHFFLIGCPFPQTLLGNNIHTAEQKTDICLFVPKEQKCSQVLPYFYGAKKVPIFIFKSNIEFISNFHIGVFTVGISHHIKLHIISNEHISS